MRAVHKHSARQLSLTRHAVLHAQPVLWAVQLGRISRVGMSGDDRVPPWGLRGEPALAAQVGSDDEGYAVRMKMRQFLGYCHDPAHAPAGAAVSIKRTSPHMPAGDLPLTKSEKPPAGP